MSALPPGIIKFMEELEASNHQLRRSAKMKNMLIVLLLAVGITYMIVVQI